jgi:hypothetical protein
VITPPGSELWSWATPLTQAASPLVTPFFSTDGYNNMIINYVFTTGTTTMTVEGSNDGTTLEATRTYTAPGASPATVGVKHPVRPAAAGADSGGRDVTSVFVKASA